MKLVTTKRAYLFTICINNSRMNSLEVRYGSNLRHRSESAALMLCVFER